MRRFRLRRYVVIVVAVLVVALWIVSQLISTNDSGQMEAGMLLGAETVAPGGPVYISIVALQKVTSKYTNHDIEINSSGIGPHSMVNLGRGEIHIATV